MDKLEQQIIDKKQLEVDLMESGIIRVGGLLIEELAAAAEDNRLTFERIRSLHTKLDEIISAFDKATDELNGVKQYYKEKHAAEDEKNKEAADDNHE